MFAVFYYNETDLSIISIVMHVIINLSCVAAGCLKLNMEFWLCIKNNWGVIVSVITALSVGYAIAKRLDQLIGKDREGRTIVERLERVEYQIFPNGGSSMADKINDLYENQAEMRSDIKEIQGQNKIIQNLINALLNKDS